ncbi:unnamed protein product (mitochondrion) [Plasmodiophora brassicae]|uniref:Uncharacterized protein n=1 Tax=Plasmodiophora brassicae TaxID=37360 RepID=A0A3P3YIS3_PLABS|nr:unnamed protein product [Plasmodiophora brassicae]
MSSKSPLRAVLRWPRRVLARAALLEAVLASLIVASLILGALHLRRPATGAPAVKFEYSTTETHVRTWTRPDLVPKTPYHEWKSSGVRPLFPRVLVLTPMKDSSKDLQLYFSLFDRISYPKELMSLGILEGDSTDDTYDRILSVLESMSVEGVMRRITLIHKNFKLGNKKLAGAERHGFTVQGRRRAVQAKARNHLMSIALHDEDIVLWLDSDLKQYPSDIVQRMLATGKRVVSADCIQTSGMCYDRNNWRETPKSLVVKQSLPEHVLMFEGYPDIMMTHRESLCDITEGIDENGLVELQGVGGTALMIEADLVREGLIFPTFPFRHAIETEGVAQVANAMNVKVYGMTNLKVFHDLD